MNSSTDTNRSGDVVLVNDDKAHRYALGRILRQGGWIVREAINGSEALRHAKEQPDLIVLDVHLPDLDGFEVCRRIKEDPDTATIMVLMLSAKYVQKEDRVQGLERGADGYLVQPVEPVELLAIVRSLLRLRWAERKWALEAERVRQMERELQAFTQMAAPPATVATAHAFGEVALRESHPALFHEFVEQYGELLEQALEEAGYKVRHGVTEKLRVLSDRLGALRLGPRDVVSLHNDALKKKIQDSRSRKNRAYVEEGRLLVLELMGHLVSHYRLFSLGGERAAATRRFTGRDRS